MADQRGYTLVELLVTMTVISVLSLGAFTLLTSLLNSAIVAKRQAVAATLANNQMEYLKSLPYDNLAVAGGAIPSSVTIPGVTTKKVNGDRYTITTSIVYADDAYDGCGSYPNQTLKQQYCRSYPPPSGAPSTDTNPADYKDINVSVTDRNGTQLASVDTNVAALVAETASNTGALFVKVVDNSGAPVVGANVNVQNSTVTPAVNVNDTTDQNGIVIFYDLPPSSPNFKYQITASLSGYSTLTTIPPNGSLQPTYPNQNLLSQSSSLATLTINPEGANSLILEATDTSGNPLPNAKIYVKGGYKKYNSTSDTTYYYDTLSPSDTRPVTDSNGLASLTNLVPGNYIFCGDAGGTSCSIGGTTYYLAAAVPYGGSNPFYPVAVPIDDPSSPPTTTFSYGGGNYLQKVRLILTNSISFPRVNNITPSDVSLGAGNLSNFAFQVNGTNLPCSASAASCSTHVSFVQNSNTYTASCTGTTGIQLSCTVNLSSAITGNAQMIVRVGSNTLTLPPSPLLGGLIVTP